MPTQTQLYHSRLYRAFLRIGPNDYQAIVHFFEQHEADILRLEQGEYFNILAAYVNALFERGEHARHARAAGEVLELSIRDNIQEHEGEDIFQKTLFRKAASHYHLGDTAQTQHILRELLRANPANGLAARFLRKAMRQEKPAYLRFARAACVFLYLCTALLVAIEIIFVRNFYRIHLDVVEAARFTILGLGLALLMGSELYHRGSTWWAVRQWQRDARQRQRLKTARLAD